MRFDTFYFWLVLVVAFEVRGLDDASFTSERRVRQGLGALGTDMTELTMVPDYETIPWRCKAVPPVFHDQRWYSQQSQQQQQQRIAEQQSAEDELGSDRTGDASSLQLNETVEGGFSHPHQQVCSWLHQYYSKRAARGVDGHLARLGNVSTGFEVLPASSSRLTGYDDGPGWFPWFTGRSEPGPPVPAPEPSPVRRSFLVIAPIGTAFDSRKWMDDPAGSTWDLIGIYYGYAADYKCEMCRKVYAGQGPKWRLMYALYSHPDWKELAAHYKGVMVVDENVALTTQTVNRAFAIMQEYDLFMAQPSVCSMAFATDAVLKQQRQYILRYTTFVQIMAPMFQMDFFNNFIAPTLYNAYAGTALDFVWPFLLRYPADKLAILDSVCVSHLDWAALSSLILPRYPTWAPYGAGEEELRRFAEYGYYASEIESIAGRPVYTDWNPFPERLIQVLGAVRDPHYHEAQGLSRTLAMFICMLAGVTTAMVIATLQKVRRKQKLIRSV